MRLRSFFFLLRLSLRRRMGHHLCVAAGVAIGALALVTAVVAGPGLAWSLSHHLKTIVPPQRIVLKPQATNLLWLQVETARLTTATLAAVRALPGVRRASPEATIRFPISAVGALMGQTYQTDITVTGVERWLLGSEVPPNFEYVPGRTREVPAVLARYFLDLYNLTLAESNRLPKLSPAAAIGRHFQIILGASSLRPADEIRRAGGRVREVDCRITGLGTNPDLLGLLIPLEAVEYFNALYGFPQKEYRAIHVDLDASASLHTLEPGFRELGLEATDRTAPLRRMLSALTLAGAAFVGLGALVFLLALAYMGSSLAWTLARRGKELLLFQALGATVRQVICLVTVESAMSSAAGVFSGTGIAMAAQYFINHWYGGWRAAGRDYLPERILGMPGCAVLFLGGACWLATVAIAWVLARRATVHPQTNGKRA